MKIKFNSDDSLLLKKYFNNFKFNNFKLNDLTVFVRSVFEEDGKYYSQVFLDESLYEL